MEILYKDEKIIPPIPNTDSGDVYVEIARTYLEMNDKIKALERLEKMVDYDIISSPQLNAGSDDENLSVKAEKKRLLKKLSAAEFECLKNDARFIDLINRANAMRV